MLRKLSIALVAAASVAAVAPTAASAAMVNGPKISTTPRIQPVFRNELKAPFILRDLKLRFHCYYNRTAPDASGHYETVAHCF